MSFGRKFGELAKSTLTPVISTRLEKTNWNPTKGSEQGNAVEQNGSPLAIFVIVIWVSLTEIVETLLAPSKKSTGTVGGGKFCDDPGGFGGLGSA